MRTLVILACSFVVAAVVASAGAADPAAGVLSVDQGRGAIVLDIRGVVHGRLASGTLQVTDRTPRDRFEEFVNGRSLTEERLGPRTVLYRGQGVRFRMIGGRYRITVRGTGVAISAHGRGVVQLDGEPRVDGFTGLYSITGADCSLEPTLCTPLPDEPQRFTLGAPDEGNEARGG